MLFPFAGRRKEGMFKGMASGFEQVDGAFDALQTALERYFSAVHAQRSEHPPDLLPVILDLDRVAGQVKPLAPAHLRHFLDSKSYRKAYDFLRAMRTGGDAAAA
jgi:hypothetical protein